MQVFSSGDSAEGLSFKHGICEGGGIRYSAKDRARKGGKPIEQWSSFTHIRKRLIESRFQNLQSGTKQKETKEKLVYEGSTYHG